MISATEAEPLRLSHLTLPIFYMIQIDAFATGMYVNWHALHERIGSSLGSGILCCVGAILILPILYVIALPSAYATMFCLRRYQIKPLSIWIIATMAANPIFVSGLLTAISNPLESAYDLLPLLVLGGTASIVSAYEMYRHWAQVPFSTRGVNILDYLMIAIGSFVILYAPWATIVAL